MNVAHDGNLQQGKQSEDDDKKNVEAFLIFSTNSVTRTEIFDELERVVEPRPAMLTAETSSRAYDLSLARRPCLTFADLTENPTSTFAILQKIGQAVPNSYIVGVFDPLRLPDIFDKSSILLQGVRCGIKDFVEAPLSNAEIRRVVERARNTLDISSEKDSTAERGKVIGFFSGKGGVGKTTIATNVAIALARRYPNEVALIDTSLDLGNVSDYLDLQCNKTLYDAVKALDRLDRDLLLSLMTPFAPEKVQVLCGPRTMQEATVIGDEDLAHVLLAAKNIFRFVIVDTLPLFNAIAIATGDLCDRIVVVSEAMIPAIRGTAGMLQRFDEVGFPANRIRILLNRYGTRFGGNVEAHLVAEALNRSIDWVLPYESKMHICANNGQAFLQVYPESKTGRKLSDLARELGELPTLERKGIWSRLIGTVKRRN